METTQKWIRIARLGHYAQETVQSLSTAAYEQNTYQVIGLRGGSIFDLLPHGPTNSRFVLQHAGIYLLEGKTILANLCLSVLLAEPNIVAGDATFDSIRLRLRHLFLLPTSKLIN